MADVRTILPSTTMPCASFPTGIRGLGGGGSSPGGGPDLPSGDDANKRPPKRPSDSARGTRSRQVASTPEGTVATQSSPSECARANRQHSKYSEMLRGMISRACDRRKPRGGLLRLPGGVCGRRGTSTAGTERLRGPRISSASPCRKCGCASTLSDSERAHGGRKQGIRSPSWLLEPLVGVSGSLGSLPRPGGVAALPQQMPGGSERCPSDEAECARSGGSSPLLRRPSSSSS
mmetsp:Transcript_4068/g.9512  ORF Transcript_4068/g.9512 Transcript_4068/m.9512 type:complete len:233 (-) Transcript_4068:141-839(-)